MKRIGWAKKIGEQWVIVPGCGPMNGWQELTVDDSIEGSDVTSGESVEESASETGCDARGTEPAGSPSDAETRCEAISGRSSYGGVIPQCRRTATTMFDGRPVCHHHSLGSSLGFVARPSGTEEAERRNPNAAPRCINRLRRDGVWYKCRKPHGHRKKCKPDRRAPKSPPEIVATPNGEPLTAKDVYRLHCEVHAWRHELRSFASWLGFDGPGDTRELDYFKGLATRVTRRPESPPVDTEDGLVSYWRAQADGFGWKGDGESVPRFPNLGMIRRTIEALVRLAPAATTERENEYRPWEDEGITETKYWERRYLEARAVTTDLAQARQHIAELEATVERLSARLATTEGAETEREFPMQPIDVTDDPRLSAEDRALLEKIGDSLSREIYYLEEIKPWLGRRSRRDR